MPKLGMGYLSCTAESSMATLNSDDKPTGIKIEEFKYQDLELATNNFSDAKLLGRGSHGLVYKAVLTTGRRVAVKKPSSAVPDEVDNEIDILSSLRSPALVNLLGFAAAGRNRRLLVVEFMSNGTLYDVLHSASRRPPRWRRRIRFALQIATAIDTLHSQSPPVIHRDIKSANVLIDRNFNARLGDFGLALRCADADAARLRSTPPAGTMGYLDPCYVTPDLLSTKADVFSFGILLLEIITGRKAIDLSHSPASVVDWAIPLIRRRKMLSLYDPRTPPPNDALVRKTLAVLAAKCVRSCRERRPSMKEVTACLAELSKLVPVQSWTGLGVNPCLTAETAVRAVGQNGPGSKNGNIAKTGRLLSSSQRMDLNFGSNLMELMAGPNGESSFRLHDHGDQRRPEFGKLTAAVNFERCRAFDTNKVVRKDGKIRADSKKRNTKK
ncbi:serine/threonine-protein kinase-like protein At3g51990 [Andrographis paniculata]|uniref:serine/threonine-protein kinase-like protein At3g51990 n=1 Tax=Andrographis paniculata TaxID=175694 RepID=UPI0021E94E69|nr:serine/threonine-protein kinase-like protein At3g51990 [Andrographis paniculata]